MWKTAKCRGAVISDAYDRMDGAVSRMARHLVASSLMTTGMLVTDGALVSMLDALPYDLDNPQVAREGSDNSQRRRRYG